MTVPVAYLDHAATSPLRPQALEAMLPWMAEPALTANPSAGHGPGRRARAALEDARHQVAGLLGVEAGAVVFCGGGTEACNLAVLGAPGGGGTSVCSAVEHHAVLRPVTARGGHVVAVDAAGVVDLDALAAALHPGVRLVSVMAVNNETGVIEPLTEVEAVVRTRAPEAALHTDAVAAGATDLAALCRLCDLVSLGFHKLGGPRGVGALVVRPGTRLAPVLYGGPQERERRPGTPDLAGIVGAAAALAVASAQRSSEWDRLLDLRRSFLEQARAAVPDLVVTAGTRPGVPGVVHVRVPGVDQEELLLLLDEAGVAASAGAACASGALEPSHVLLAMGQDPSTARQAVRFSMGWSTTPGEVAAAAAALGEATSRLRR